MRYILDSDGYIQEYSFEHTIICDGNTCTEYIGTNPEGYDSLEAWAIGEDGKINAWKIQDGNLVFDNAKYNELKILYEQQDIDNSYVQHKEIFELQQSVEDIQSVSNSQYKKMSSSGKIIAIDNVIKYYPDVKITDIKPYNYSKVDIISTGRNILTNTATTQTISGVTFTQNADRSITIDGSSTATIEYNIAGNSTNTSPFLCLKKNKNYILSGLESKTIKMYYYDGTDRTEVYSGTGGDLCFTDSDKPITQIVISIPSSTTNNDLTIFPMLEYGTIASQYEKYQGSKLTIDFSQYVKEGLFLGSNTFLGSSTFLFGTIIDYITINNNSIVISVDGEEINANTGNVQLLNGYNTIYTIQDTNIDIDYCINVLNIDDLEFLQGKSTTTNNFKVLDDGSIEANNGSFSGDIFLSNGSKIIGGSGRAGNLFFKSDGQFGSFSFIGYIGGYSGGNPIIYYQNTYLDIEIPENFTIISATISLMCEPSYWEDGWGYSRNIKIYKINDGYSYKLDNVNTIITCNNDYLTEIPNALGVSSYTPTNTSGDTVTTKTGTIPISYLQRNTTNNGHITLVAKTSDSIPSYTSSDVMTHTGGAILSINILGYMNDVIESEE